MRILQVVHGWFPRHSGGTERYVAAVSKELVARGHEVAILSGSERTSSRGVLEREVWEGMPLYRLRRSGLYLESWYHSYHPDAEHLFAELLDGLKPDLVHIHHWHRLTRNLVEIATAHGIPSVLTLHDTTASCPRSLRIRDGVFCERAVSPANCGDCAERFFFQSDEEVDSSIESYRADFEQELRLAGVLIAPSESLAEVVAGQFPSISSRIEILRHGTLPAPAVKKPRAPRGRSKGPLRLVYWGELSRLKGLELLTEALERSRRPERLSLDLWGNFPDGDAEFEDRIRKRLNELSIRVELKGSFSPDELPSNYDLAVFPSIACESHSFTVDEAFQRGIPVLVPDRGGPADRLDGAGVVFRHEDAKDLARVIDRSAEHPEKIAEWRRAVRAPKTMKHHVDELGAIYREVGAAEVRGNAIDPRLARLRAQMLLNRNQARDQELYAIRGKLDQGDGRVVELRRELAQRDATIRQRDEVLVEFNAELKRLSHSLESSEEAAARRLESQGGRISELEKILEDRDASIRARDRELRNYENSVTELERSLESRRLKLAERDEELNDARIRVERAENQKADLSIALERAEAVVGERDKHVANLEQSVVDLRDLLSRREVATEELSELAERAQTVEEQLRAQEDAAVQLTSSLQAHRAESQAQIQRLETIRDNLEKRLEATEKECLRINAALAASESSLAEARDESRTLRAQIAERLGPIVEEIAGHEIAGETPEQIFNWTVANHGRLHGLLGERDALIHALAKEIEAEEDRRGASRGKSDRPSSRRARLEGKLKAWRRRLAPRRPDGRLKLLYVIHDFLPKHAAGTEIYTYKLLKELRERHDVELIFCEARHELPRYTVSKGEFDGLPYTEVVHNYQWENFEETYHDPRMEAIFEEVLEDFQPDLVHIQHLHYFSFNFIPMIKSRGIPVVYTLHEFMLMCARGGQLLREDLEICEKPVPEKCADCIRHQPLGETYSKENIRRRLEMAERRLPADLHEAFSRFTGPLAGAPLTEEGRAVYAEAIQRRLDFIGERAAMVDLFISPSAFLRQKFIDVGMMRPEQIIHSDNGFDLTPFDGVERVSSSRLRFGFVGTIAEYKGVHLMIEAFQTIEDPDVELHIWGDIETFVDYKERLLSLQRGENVRLRGRFDNSKIAEVLATIDVLIVPSLWFENSPLTIHEAWMAGIPVIASDRGGMAELVEDGVNGLHFRLGDAQDLAAKIRHLIEHPELIEEFRKHLGVVKPIADNAREIEGYYHALLRGVTPQP